VPEARGQGGGQEHPSREQRVASLALHVYCLLGNLYGSMCR
jgi:hypothetical protein